MLYSPVSVVKENLFNEGEDGELKEYPVERRKFQDEAAAAITHEPVEDEAERDTNDRLVEDDHQNGMLQLSRVHLNTNTKITVRMACFSLAGST